VLFDFGEVPPTLYRPASTDHRIGAWAIVPGINTPLPFSLYR
jgi:hypothetical protein